MVIPFECNGSINIFLLFTKIIVLLLCLFGLCIFSALTLVETIIKRVAAMTFTKRQEMQFPKFLKLPPFYNE